MLLQEQTRTIVPEAAEREFSAAGRIACFFALLAMALFGLDAMITHGLRRLETGLYGVSNRIMEGRVNAQIVVTGSSRALSHYDSRILQSKTGWSAYNLGRNGSQTTMQLAVLRAYLAHNRKPELILHNLDSFSFEATRQVYNPGQYVPYLYEQELYRPLRSTDPQAYKRRYLPLYGYVVDDMSFSWMLGLARLAGWSPAEDHFLGFNPRSALWSDEFERFRAANPNGVSWPIDQEGVEGIESLAGMCRERGIRLVLVYSPEYKEMQGLTRNRAEVFDRFREVARRYQIPFWDYSGWEHSGSTQYFQNSQHLNADGAEVFSEDVADRVRGHLALGVH